MRYKLFVLLLLIIVMTGCQTDGPSNYTVSQELEVVSQSPSTAVERFFEAYSLYPGNPLVTEAYRQNENLHQYLSSAMKDEVDEIIGSFQKQGGAYDPFFCAQDRPGNIEFLNVSENRDTAQILMIPEYSGIKSDEVLIDLVLVDNGWLINHIECPDAGSAPNEFASSTAVVHAPESDVLPEWIPYRNDDYGFQLNIPPDWNTVFCPVTDHSGNDPVEGYITFHDAQGMIPVCLIVIDDSGDVFREVFPMPESGSEERIIAGNRVVSEVVTSGEIYHFIQHPCREGFIIGVRLIDRDELYSDVWYEIVEEILLSFSFIEERS